MSSVSYVFYGNLFANSLDPDQAQQNAMVFYFKLLIIISPTQIVCLVHVAF